MPPRENLLIDPTSDAAAVLRRVGFLALMLAFPLSALLLRVGPVLTFAISVALLLVAAVLDTPARVVGERLLRLLRYPAVLAILVAIGWVILSLAWTPIPAWRHDLAVLAILGLALAGFLALPDRMRSANLYPIPVGAGFLAVATIVLSGRFWSAEVADAVRLERSTCVLVLLVWPAIAWLRSRRRDVEAVALSFGTALAAALAPGPGPLAALACGALVHLLAQLSARLAVWLGFGTAALLVVTPGLVAMIPHIPSVPESFVVDAERWHRVLLGDPLRLVTGHGAGSMQSRPDLVRVPGSAPLALWYELGVIGVVAVAVAVAAWCKRLPDKLGRLMPSAMGAGATAIALALGDLGGGALWWPVTLVTVGLLFVAARRGQFRTRRPHFLTAFVRRGSARSVPSGADPRGRSPT